MNNRERTQELMQRYSDSNGLMYKIGDLLSISILIDILLVLENIQKILVDHKE